MPATLLDNSSHSTIRQGVDTDEFPLNDTWGVLRIVMPTEKRNRWIIHRHRRKDEADPPKDRRISPSLLCGSNAASFQDLFR